MLDRLTEFCYRRRRLVVAGWLVILVATAVAGSRFGGGDTTDYGTPGRSPRLPPTCSTSASPPARATPSTSSGEPRT